MTATKSTWARAKKTIVSRDGGVCQRCGDWGDHVHHVLPRHKGGKDNGSTPLLLVCGPCHTYIHKNGTESVAKGWLIRR